MKELQRQDKNQIEYIQQKKVEIEYFYDGRITILNRNHSLFEVDLSKETIVPVVYDSVPEIKWADAVNGNISHNRKLTKKPNCVYIPALNEKAVRKILKRDFKLLGYERAN